MIQFPKIMITRNNDNLSILLGGKHYLFQGKRVEELFDAAMKYKQALLVMSKESVEKAFEELNELLSPILRKEVAQYFTTDGTNVYLGNTDIPIPDSLFDLVNDFITKGYPIESFANFWRFCLMNPNPDARDRFFDYCKTYGITITDKGYAVLYKAVNKKAYLQDSGLAEFVSTNWLKVKRWKKSPANYYVNQTDDNSYVLSTDNSKSTVGNLAELHENITELSQNDNLSFRPIHSGNHGMNIQLGVAVTMPREECDFNISNECSYGLHIGSFKYVKAFASSSNTILACLVNPMDIVALPAHDNSKIRTCRYLPYAIIERDEYGIWTELESVGFEDDFILQEDEAILQVIKDNPSALTQHTVDQIVSSIPLTKLVEYEFLIDNCGNDYDYDDFEDDWENGYI
jgi:hypothetical protein